jgi:predicted dehydrogenase
MSMHLPSSRRHFLKFSAAAAAAGIFAPNILRAEEVAKKLNFAGIGVGGKGASDIANAAKEANIVAICDVDRNTLKKAQEKYPNAKAFESFREMFDALGDKIDGVTISTPDHQHFPAAMEAIKRGKHICVQKPLVNRMWEANQLQLAAKKKGVKTNMGNQGHTGEQIRVLKEWLSAGLIGKVKEIHVWTNRPIWPQGQAAKDKIKPSALPASLNWKEWLAQCPDVEYLTGLHPFAWRGHFEYGAGAMGDMGCHLLDGPFWGCDLGEPYKMEAEVTDMTDISWPKSSRVVCHFKTPNHGKVKLFWYEGGQKPAKPVDLPPEVNWEKTVGGFIIYGDEGTVFNAGDYCSNLRLLPQERYSTVLRNTQIAKTLERSIAPGDPQLELVRAITQNKECGGTFDYSVPLTKLCLLGNLAMTTPGKELDWDSEKQEVKGKDEVNKWLKRAAVRQGWDYSVDKI